MMAIRCSDTLTMPEGERRADALIAAMPSPGLAADLGRGRSARPARIRLGQDPGPYRLDARPRALAAGPPLAQRPGRDRLLRLLRAPPLQHRRPGLDRRQQVARRRMLPAGQGRGRARPVPGPYLAGLVCPHHLVHARPGLAGRQPGPGRKKGTGTSDPGMIGYTLPGDPPPADQPGPGLRTRPRRRLVLVPLAPATPVPGPPVPLPAPRLRTSLTDLHRRTRPVMNPPRGPGRPRGGMMSR